MKVTVDRFEGEITVLPVRPEEQDQIPMPRHYLPSLKGGDIVDITVRRDVGETEETRARVSSLIEMLKRKEE